MRDTHTWRRYARFWGADTKADIDDELAFHFEMRAQEAKDRGLSEQAAVDEAVRSFGNRSRIEGEMIRIGHRIVRRDRRAGTLAGIYSDMRHSLRGFVRRPALPLTIVLTLGLGIGATTAVFTLFDAVVLNPLPVRDAETLFALQSQDRGIAGPGLSYPMVKALQKAASDWTITAEGQLDVGVRFDGYTDQVIASVITGNYFEVLGVLPARGRLLRPDDEGIEGTTPSVIISDAFWHRAIGADRSVVGRSLYLNGHPFTIVGIAPPGFRGTSLGTPPDIWFSITMLRTIANGGMFASPEVLTTEFLQWLDVAGRANSLDRKESGLGRINAAYAARQAEIARPAEPTKPRATARNTAPAQLAAIPIMEAATGRSRADVLRFVIILWVVAAFCLTIACANVANLLLVRAAQRWREVALRMALGAGRARVFLHVLAESLVLALSGGLLGLAIARIGLRLLTTYSLPGNVALDNLQLTLDARMVAFALALAAISALVFGAVPAFVASRPRLMDAITEMRQGAGARGWNGGNALIGAQVALSLVLVVGALLFIRSLRAALAVDLGYDIDRVAAVTFDLNSEGYSKSQIPVFMQRALDAGRSRFDAVALATSAPPDPASTLPVMPIGPQAVVPSKRGTRVSAVSDGFFELFRIRPITGRVFNSTDRDGTTEVAVVTESAARAFWPNVSAVGQKLQLFPGLSDGITVIGVVPDAHYVNVGTIVPHVFVSLQQEPGMLHNVEMIARGPGTANTTLSMQRDMLKAMDPRITLFNGRALDSQVDRLLMPQRFGSTLLSIFAGIACIISAVGIYSVVAHNVDRRRRELGIRAALGASRHDLTSAVLTRTAIAVTAGTVVGLIVAAVLTTGLNRFLFGITPYEPWSYALAAFTFAALAAAATWLPTRRAQRVDPVVMMRE